jgi:hypothetical protein
MDIPYAIPVNDPVDDPLAPRVIDSTVVPGRLDFTTWQVKLTLTGRFNALIRLNVHDITDNTRLDDILRMIAPHVVRTYEERALLLQRVGNDMLEYIWTLITKYGSNTQEYALWYYAIGRYHPSTKTEYQRRITQIICDGLIRSPCLLKEDEFQLIEHGDEQGNGGTRSATGH